MHYLPWQNNCRYEAVTSWLAASLCFQRHRQTKIDSCVSAAINRCNQPASKLSSFCHLPPYNSSLLSFTLNGSIWSWELWMLIIDWSVTCQPSLLLLICSDVCPCCSIIVISLFLLCWCAYTHPPPLCSVQCLCSHVFQSVPPFGLLHHFCSTFSGGRS